MKKNEYIQRLNDSLKHLSQNEREEIVAYYEEYFEGARVEGYSDEFIADSLGSPYSVAAQIDSGDGSIVRRARRQKTINDAVENPKAKTVVPALFAGATAAISLPFRIIGFIVAIVCLIVFTSILIGFYAAGISLAVSGVAVFACSFVLFSGSVAIAILYLAAGVLVFGLGLMMLAGITSALKPVYKGLAKAVKKITVGKRRYVIYEKTV